MICRIGRLSFPVENGRYDRIVALNLKAGYSQSFILEESFERYPTMANFEVLKNNQLLMVHLGIYFHPVNDPTNKLLASLISSYFIFITVAFGIISSVLFAFENASEFEAALNAVMVVIAETQSIAMYFSVRINIDKVKTLHLMLQEITDKGS